MKKYIKAVVNLLLSLIILLLLIFALPRLLLLFLPFVIGWIIAMIAYRPVCFLEEKLNVRRRVSSAIVVIVVIALVVFILYLVGAKLVEEIIGLASALPDMWNSLEAEFNEIGRRLSVVYSRLPTDVQSSITDFPSQAGEYLGNIVSRIGTPTIAAAGNIAKQLPTIIIGVIMALLSSYLFIADREAVNSWFAAHIPHSIQQKWNIIRRSLVKAVGGYLRAQLKIEMWMYLLLVIGLTILNVDYTLLIALGIAILDLLPFFGTGTVMVPWAIIKILSSDYKMAIGLLIIGGVGQLARQIIQPKIVGDSVGMPALPTLMLLYVGFKLAGVLGMIVAVPLGLIIVTMYEEGAFDTTSRSIRIIVDGINNFRKLTDDDIDN
ncbi:MAG: sporulation integral membrane protein YtvI [Lachnospiraceae bacterium]|nr:sporulation integral membrane protein YtvI [Lachnospiraceae bacterium]